MSYVYLLESTKGYTYVGATVDLDRRIRQHNREIKGGAKATSNDKWKIVLYVSGFPNWQSALQFEWKWKNLTRKISRKKNPIDRRLASLLILVNSPKSTSKSILFTEWGSPIIINSNLHLELKNEINNSIILLPI